MARDPVCGMQVKETEAAATAQHMGQTYYFCSGACKAQCEKNPGKYVGQHETRGEHRHGHG
ncbi:MAG: YHS domain-containing protein [Firmicutes bacterium]|nr:YHS domain-containing protein [Bacillota bacterium]